MARNKSPYDFLKEHIRGIYFPLHYGKPAPVQMSLSRSNFQNRPFEAVVKVVSHIKAGRGPLNAMRYLAQKSAGLEEVRPLYDEEGTLLKPDDFERFPKCRVRNVKTAGNWRTSSCLSRKRRE